MSARPLSFPMEAAAAGTLPHPGVQVLLTGDPGALEAGVPASENQRCAAAWARRRTGALGERVAALWVHAIGAGTGPRAPPTAAARSDAAR